ncbi:hypothetical protein Nepgr_028769 [Nepenthes gracilis]|uniref:Uncharacterized protein n=1 Tax=Nepenthes gracilis TaxID=150966 RepID=A0AAD3Y4W4_NEPGR|nr:hypothetical protein Nepgr_028769 [Nepenthes gracilis]
MCLTVRFSRMNTYSKKQCRSLFWKVRRAVKNAVKSGGKHHPNFQYDPSSYALNFDDGEGNEAHGYGFHHIINLHDYFPSANNAWVYVLWIKA